jgi:hypothetical protein
MEGSSPLHALRIKMLLPILLWCICLAGCNINGLSVHTDYLSRQNLASYHVNTPDPRLSDPPIGQRLIITWAFPKHYLSLPDLHLELTLRFRTREQAIQDIPLSKASGTFVYALLNEEYFDKQGILTYKVRLIGNGQVLDEWKHQMWTELITFSDEPETYALPQIDELLCPADPEEERRQDDHNFEFEETTLPQDFRLK